MNAVGFLPEKVFNDFIDRLDSIYENAVTEIQRNLDLINFGWDCWEIDGENEDGSDEWKRADDETVAEAQQFPNRWKLYESTGRIATEDTESGHPPQHMIDSKHYDRVSKEWQSAIVKPRGTSSECVGTVKSGAIQRVRFVLTLFREHVLEQMVHRNDVVNVDGPSTSSEKAIYVDLFAECLSKYDAVSLLNDFELIRQHRTGTEELRDCKMSGPLSVCCGELVRGCRKSEDENVRGITMKDDRLEFKQFIDSLDTKQRAVIEITSKIQMFINHSTQRQMKEELIDDNEEKRDEERIWRRRRKRILRGSSGRTFNKFVIEMGKQNETPKMDELQSILHRGTLSRSNAILFLKYLKSEDIDSDAMDDDLRAMLTPRAHEEICTESNLFPFFQNDMVTAKNVLSHLNKLPLFRFGYTVFSYLKHNEGGNSYIKSPKYKNLKAECLQNNIYPISRSVFVRILELARTLWRTEKGRSLKAMDNRDWNSRLEIPPHSPVSISHIFVLLMYCNYTELQYQYKKKGCREMTDIQSPDDPKFEEMKRRNSEIGWWYRLIHDAVNLWGTKASKNEVFLTGLDRKMIFDDMVPHWNCPFSSTVSPLIAVNFATEKGIILQTTPLAISQDKYFNCEWLSDYPHERERLFVRARDLQIADIRSFDFEQRVWISHSQYIQCMSFLSRLFSGHFVVERLKTTDKLMEMDMMLLSMIRRFQSNDSMQNEIDNEDDIETDLYMEQLFIAVMKELGHSGMILPESGMRPCFVIKSQFKLLSEELQRKLLLFDDWDNMMISPILKSVGRSLTNTKLMREYIWRLNEKDLRELRAMVPGVPMFSAKEYSHRDENGSMIRFDLCLTRNQSGSEYAGFGFRIKKMPYLSASGLWGVAIKEVKWQMPPDQFGLAEGGMCGVATGRSDFFDAVPSITIHFALWTQGKNGNGMMR